ncbi:hypothetical protein CAY35_02955 [Pseudoglutamicibacter cumminsii]|uniref:SURF1-like protein n=1 Tax=Pseudoglutamicibacter cumminsii TaxID=156979 RepID=A0ABX5L8C2_9MICC|nr:hypothetical protein CAY35_02955 [Pseudoglutamicibacter cumminsii]
MYFRGVGAHGAPVKGSCGVLDRIRGVLKTALQPKWLALLLACLVVSTGFVWLSKWQFDRSVDRAPTTQEQSETAVPLESHFEPGKDMTHADADQIVTMKGRYIEGTQAYVQDRLFEGEQGFWVVQAFEVDGVSDVMPVVRGWQPGKSEVPPATDADEVTVTGRLWPSEAPVARGREDDLHGLPVLKDVSAARLSNMWNRDAYAGFVVVFEQSPDDVKAGVDQLKHVYVAPGYLQENQLNWLNVFYGVEWIVFAVFSLFVWWRLVRDDYQNELKFEAELAAWQKRQDARVAQAQAEARERLAAQASGRELGDVGSEDDAGSESNAGLEDNAGSENRENG